MELLDALIFLNSLLSVSSSGRSRAEYQTFFPCTYHLTRPRHSVPALHSSQASSPLNTVLFYSARHHHSDASADRSMKRNIKTQARSPRGPRGLCCLLIPNLLNLLLPSCPVRLYPIVEQRRSKDKILKAFITPEIIDEQGRYLTSYSRNEIFLKAFIIFMICSIYC